MVTFDLPRTLRYLSNYQHSCLVTIHTGLVIVIVVSIVPNDYMRGFNVIWGGLQRSRSILIDRSVVGWSNEVNELNECPKFQGVQGSNAKKYSPDTANDWYVVVVVGLVVTTRFAMVPCSLHHNLRLCPPNRQQTEHCWWTQWIQLMRKPWKTKHWKMWSNSKTLDQ